MRGKSLSQVSIIKTVLTGRNVAREDSDILSCSPQYTHIMLSVFPREHLLLVATTQHQKDTGADTDSD